MFHVFSLKETPHESQNVIISVKFRYSHSTTGTKSQYCMQRVERRVYIFYGTLNAVSLVEYFLTLYNLYKTTVVNLFSNKIDLLAFSLAIRETCTILV